MIELIPAWVNGTLQPVEKRQVHLHGLKHLAVSVFVMQGDRTLLQRRALSKYHTPGLWTNTCCTHPNWQEDPGHCAARRLTEEMGITGLDLRSIGSTEYRAEVGNGMIEHEVVKIFAAEAPDGFSMQVNPDEVMDTDWMTLDRLDARVRAEPALFTPWMRIYLTEGWGKRALQRGPIPAR